MSSSSALAPVSSFQLRGRQFTLLALRALDAADPARLDELAQKVAQTPNFYHQAPLVLDLDGVAEDGGLDLAALVQRLDRLQLITVGATGGTQAVRQAALAAGLAILPPGRAEPTARPVPAPPAGRQTARNTTITVTEPVRSGRQIHAPHGDLVVVGAVSAGAELLAAGSIHIYGPLRGRALAGVDGDTQARIFCHGLEAELVSVAGLYRLADDIAADLRRRPAQIFLHGEELLIQPL